MFESLWYMGVICTLTNSELAYWALIYTPGSRAASINSFSTRFDHDRPKGGGGGGCDGCDCTPLLEEGFLDFFLRGCYRGWRCTKIPLPRVWKIDPNFFEKEKKLSESPPSRLAADPFSKSFLRAWFDLRHMRLLTHF